MRSSHLKHFAVAAALIAALAAPSPCRAQPGVGTWVRQTEKSAKGGMSMVVEPCCNDGRRLTYRLTGARTVMTLESPFDGSDAALLIDGKPSGETMAISRVDARHTITILKLNGRKFGTSKAELSEDGKKLTMEDDITANAGGHTIGRQTEIWVRK